MWSEMKAIIFSSHEKLWLDFGLSLERFGIGLVSPRPCRGGLSSPRKKRNGRKAKKMKLSRVDNYVHGIPWHKHMQMNSFVHDNDDNIIYVP